MRTRLPMLAIALAAAATLVAIGCSFERSEIGKRPNVLLIVVDTLRADHLGVYGYERPVSPTIDRLAKDSIVFEDVTAHAPSTLPSMLQLMTGQLILAREIPPAHQTLAERFAKAGYATLAIVDNPVIELRDTGLRRGFAEFYANAPLDERVNQQHWKTSTPADVITRRAIRWLEERSGREPFFAWLHYFDPHDPYHPPFLEDAPFDLESGSSWTGDVRRNPIYRANPADRDGTAASDADRQRLIDLYDAEIHYLDRSLGDLLDSLERMGLYDDTLVLLTSDHGEAFGEHGQWTHGRSLHQVEIRVPLIAKLPEPETRHEVSSATAQLLDVFPTLCAWVGLDCPEKLAGRDLLNGAAPQDAYALWNHWAVARDGRWKLLENARRGTRQLFDLERDPGETRDLADSEPEVVERLQKRKEAWLRSMGRVPRDAAAESAEQVEQLRALGYLD